MSERGHTDRLAALTRAVGVGGVRFVEYADGELRRRARELAIAEGLTAREADALARIVVVAAVKAASGAVKQAMRDRAFARQS